jgi:parallel beta-helix repeat protein
LKQVASGPSAGQFAVGSARRVVLKVDPRDHSVEVSVRRHWILGSPKADDVTIEGFTMRHAANESRSGALMNRESRSAPGGSRWTVQNNGLSHAHGAVIFLKGATGLRILDNDISYGGQIGINGAGNGEIIRRNDIHHNNTENYNMAGAEVTEAGGAKFAPEVENVVFAYNEVYRNKGNGVHFDIDTANNTISNNRIHHNARKGIQYELSSGGKIFSNVLWENGWAIPDRMQGGAIVLMNSSSTEVYNNTLAWNADGIAVYALDREGTEWDRVHDVYIHHNIILAKDYASDPRNNLALGWLQGWSNTLFTLANNNRGAYNKYWYPEPESSSTRFEWNQIGLSKLLSFNITRGEENGRYLTQSEKDTVVANKGIPANPLSR